MVEPGRILLGKYRIERVLGRGGIGVVAKAHHIDLNEPVAIKFLLPEMAQRAEVVKRFAREAQAAVKLKNEHVCRVLDVGRLDDGAPYIVMEYMEGTDLRGVLVEHGRLAPAFAVDLMLHACLALAEAHSLGIVHRDLKPGNMFVTERSDGEPLLKVLDFGISKAPLEISTEITNTESVLGTPSYMSPEQMRTSKHVDGRSDIWALGVVLYELVSGTKPFRSRVLTELCLEVVMDPPKALAVPLPAELTAAIMRCLEKEREARFQNVAQLAASLVEFASVPATAWRIAERCSKTLGLARARRSGTRLATAMSVDTSGPSVARSAMLTPSRPIAAPVVMAPPAASAGGKPPTTMSTSAGELRSGADPARSARVAQATNMALVQPSKSRRGLVVAVTALGVVAAVVAVAVLGPGPDDNVSGAPGGGIERLDAMQAADDLILVTRGNDAAVAPGLAEADGSDAGVAEVTAIESTSEADAGATPGADSSSTGAASEEQVTRRVGAELPRSPADRAAEDQAERSRAAAERSPTRSTRSRTRPERSRTRSGRSKAGSRKKSDKLRRDEW